MLDLELATTEQILDELARRPVKFVHVCTLYKGEMPTDGYIAYSPTIDCPEAVLMLRKAQELLQEPDDTMCGNA